MVSVFTYASVAVATSAAVLSSVDAHQRVTIPAPTFTNNDRNVNWNPLAFLENQGVKAGDDLTGFLRSKGIKTLRDYMDNKANYKIEARGASFECGYTNPNGARQPIPKNGMMRSTGYTHDGPCEVWLDNTRVLGSYTGNCHRDVGSKAVSYKIDFSKCKGNCMLRWYWLGKRLIGGKKWSWQIYKACVPLKGSGTAARSIDAEDDGFDAYNSTDSDFENNYEAEAETEETPVPTPAPEEENYEDAPVEENSAPETSEDESVNLSRGYDEETSENIEDAPTDEDIANNYD